MPRNTSKGVRKESLEKLPPDHITAQHSTAATTTAGTPTASTVIRTAPPISAPGSSRGCGEGAPSRKRKNPYINNDVDDDNDSGCVMSSANRNFISSQPSSPWNNGNSQPITGGRSTSSLSSGYGSASLSTAHNGSFPSTRDTDSSTAGADLTCGCGLKAVKRTVRKEGPNKGRQFYTCAKSQENQCGFFQWSEDSDNNDATSTSTRYTGGAPGYLPPAKKSCNISLKAKRKCSICRQEGHNKKNCPQSKQLSVEQNGSFSYPSI